MTARSRFAALLLMTAAAFTASPPAQAPLAAAQRVVLRAEDGVSLGATWYEPYSRPAPAVILVHMLQGSRRDWESLPQRLSAAGFGVLAFDLRGHGDSLGSAQDFAAMRLDFKAARRYVSSRADVVPGGVGVAAASLGASVAVLAAAEDSGIASLALLSPTLEYRGLRCGPCGPGRRRKGSLRCRASPGPRARPARCAR